MNKEKKQRQIIDLIKYPIITDKTTKNIENNIYYFAVNKQSNKKDIKTAIEYIFDVQVIKINTINSAPKSKRIGKFKGHITQHKKAIIKLNNASKINLFEGN
uniref:Large ribosomal subunit protein uL23c n=1 Tax=Bostrychia simpliciuscula TaxID=324754 RepID=A0A1Z1M897_9FLOR|nr:ribosomal protein L23 [Bostrychia simpliciuscula]ARW62122.1 ribosomal protein L23 [Bostrychia simpliciuscula]